MGRTYSILEWEPLKLRTKITCICPLKVVIELDPGMSVDKTTYVFSMDELLSTQEVLIETVGLVEGVEETPVMRTVPHTIASFPLHADLSYTSDAARTSEEVPASSAVGTVECPACKMEVVVRELQQHVWGRTQKSREALFAFFVPLCTHANPRVVVCWARRIALPRNL